MPENIKIAVSKISGSRYLFLLSKINIMGKSKAEILQVAGFQIYGVGNFDITTEETNNILTILESENSEQKLIEFYEKLSKIRLG